MIRSALIALGLSAGAASAQAMVSTGPIVDTCGGTRIFIEAVTPDGDAAPDAAALGRAAAAISTRIGALTVGLFDYADVRGDQIVVSLPPAMGPIRPTLDAVLEPLDFGFYPVVDQMPVGDAFVLKAGHMQRLSSDPFHVRYVLQDAPIVSGDHVADARASFDANGNPAVAFTFTGTGQSIFGRYTTEHVGSPIAIVLRDEVVSAPIIRDPITGGQGIITGAFSVGESELLAAMLRGGLPPFDLVIVKDTRVNGSDPSADFCP